MDWGELAALGAAISWTASALLYRKALQSTKPISANVLRLSFTGGMLTVFLLAVSGFQLIADEPPSLVLFAVLSGIVGLGLGDTLYMVSIKRIGVSRAVPITCTYPLFNFVWAVFFLGQPVTAVIISGAIIIILGIWLVSRRQEEHGAKVKNGFLMKGGSAALATAVLWSISIAMVNVAVNEAPDFSHALAINTIRVASVGAVMLTFSPLFDRGLSYLKVDRKTLALLIAGGMVALGLGWFLLTYSFVTTPETVAVPISSTTPLFSTIVGIIMLKEKAGLKCLLGSILIVAGIFLIFIG